MRFHADYLNARSIFYDNIVVFPELKYSQGQTSDKPPAANEDSPSADTTTSATATKTPNGATADKTKVAGTQQESCSVVTEQSTMAGSAGVKATKLTEE